MLRRNPRAPVTVNLGKALTKRDIPANRRKGSVSSAPSRQRHAPIEAPGHAVGADDHALRRTTLERLEAPPKTAVTSGACRRFRGEPEPQSDEQFPPPASWGRL